QEVFSKNGDFYENNDPDKKRKSHWSLNIPGQNSEKQKNSHYIFRSDGNDNYINKRGNVHSGQGVSNSTLDGINTAANIGGRVSNIWSDAARYSIEGMSKPDIARPLVRGIGIGVKTIGYTGMIASLGIDMYKYNQNPTWGNAGRVGIVAAAIGISYAWHGPGTAIGVGTAALNAAGGLNGFYNFLDANQSLYKSNGHIMVPGLNPFNPLTIIKIK
ncbi:MAG: hypothetical protein Q8907_09290, partial [Bacteroidota bacterium]|nr:hypothetical protein [Bacteroidota bacterium]